MADAGRILIVGGGIAGLSLAIALRRHGAAAAELVERSPAWPAVGAGIALHANAVRALRALGVGEAIEAASARCHAGGSSTSTAGRYARPTSRTCGARSVPARGSPGYGCKRSCSRRRPVCGSASAWNLPA